MLRDQVSMRVVPREMSEFNPVPECSYCVPGRFFICGPASRLMSMKKTTGTEIQLDIKSTDVKCS